jgi:hypothetical protein
LLNKQKKIKCSAIQTINVLLRRFLTFFCIVETESRFLAHSSCMPRTIQHIQITAPLLVSSQRVRDIATLCFCVETAGLVVNNSVKDSDTRIVYFKHLATAMARSYIQVLL